MIRRISFLILIPVIFTAAAFALTDEEMAAIPQSISNNSYYRESVRYTKLAEETYASGDYDVSASFAQEAVRFTLLSDEYVSSKLIEEAGRMKNAAEKNALVEQFPNNYNLGVNQYETALEAHSKEEWNSSITSAINAIEIFGVFEGRPTVTAAGTGSRTGTTTAAASGLPGQYTVRSWVVEKDCLWNIAGYSWVYGDPWKWRILFEANKSRMPDPNNPDLIEPGMILEIPSLTEENRQGMWRP